MTEQVLKVLGKLDEWNTQSIIWVKLEQAIFCKKKHEMYLYNQNVINIVKL